jgi:hypothetical protein
MNFIYGKCKRNDELINKMLEKSITESNYDIKSFVNKIYPSSPVCRYEVNIKEVKKNIESYITIYTEENTEITGIVTFQFDKEKIKIKTLCSSTSAPKGNGKMLLDTVLDIAKDLGVKSVSLIPLGKMEVINYYKNNGFVEEGLTMVYKIDGGGKTTKRRNRKKTTKSGKTTKRRNRKNNTKRYFK